MNKEYEFFEKVITNRIDEIKRAIRQFSIPFSGQSNDLLGIIQNEKERIKRAILNNAYLCITEEQSQIYIQNNLNSIEHLFSLFSKHEYADAFNALDEIYIFIYKSYNDLVPGTTLLPLNSIIFKQENVGPRLVNIFKKLQDSHHEDKILIITEEITRSFIQSIESERISIQEFKFYKNFILECEQYLDTKGIKKSILQLVVSLNYNSAFIAHSIVENIQIEYEAMNNLPDALSVLMGFKKQLSQIQTLKHFPYNPKAESLKEHLSKWINEEINFINHQKEVLKLSSPGTLNNAKFLTSLSTAQLGYFFKVMVKGKIMCNENQSELIKLIANNFSTKIVSTISPGGMRGNYYDAEEGTKQHMKKILLELVKEID